jgi:DNA-binding CsgD family transcriptional regulator
VTEIEIRVVDEPIRADQYLYISTHGWAMAGISLLRGRSGVPVTQFRYLAEHRSDQWVPADPSRDWLIDRRPTGRRQWLVGSEEEARAAGYDVEYPGPVGRFQAPHGDFYAHLNGQPPRPHPGGWQMPDPSFLAALPRDPATGLLAPSVTRRLIEEFALRPVAQRPRPDRLRSLTPRETEVLVLMAGGLCNSEIAERLGLAEQTVKTHVGRILAKLDVRDRVQAVVVAYETGLAQASGPRGPAAR